MSDNDKPIILITGGTGWLAQHIVKTLLDDLGGTSITDFEVHVTYRGSERPHWISADRCHQMDLQDDLEGLTQYPSDDMLNDDAADCLQKIPKKYNSSVSEVFAKVLPDVLVHCAAVASPAACESNNRFWRVNTPRGIVSSVREYVPNCVVIFTSTDLVYPGHLVHEPIRPDDPEFISFPPVSAYGKSKIAFESEILGLPYGIVLRLSNMIGPSPPFKVAQAKFLTFLETFMTQRRALDMKNDEFRCFVSVFDVIFVIKSIIVMRLAGGFRHGGAPVDRSLHPCFAQGGSIYNIGGPDCLSRLDLAILLAQMTGTPFEVSEKKDGVIVPVISNTSEVSVSSDDEVWRLLSVPANNIPIQVPAAPKVNVDVSLTERHFNFRVSNMTDLIQQIYKL